MSKRYGRNQKRAHRARIAEMEAAIRDMQCKLGTTKYYASRMESEIEKLLCDGSMPKYAADRFRFLTGERP